MKNFSGQREKAGGAVSKLLFLSVLAVFVLLPLVRMLFYIDGQSLREVFSAPYFKEAVLNSLSSGITASLISLVLAYFLAVCLLRVDIRLKNFFSVIFVLPMLIPSISHGMGLLLILGNNGLFTRLLNLNTSIYGFWGVVIGSVMYTFPVAFLMFSDILKYEDYSPYEAAKVLGVPGRKRFLAITLPYLRRPLISIVFSVFTMIITDYGVPLIIGGKFKTVSSVMYQEAVSRLNFDNGAVLGAVLLLPAVLAFIFDLLNRDKGNMTFVTRAFAPSKSRGAKAAAYVFCTAISLAVLVPLLSFVLIGFAKRYPTDLTFTLKNMQKTFAMDAGRYLGNSVFIALWVSVLGMGISFFTAYLTARMKTGLSRALHLLCITAAAIPGIVLGLSYAVTFNKSAIYNTFAILIAANLVHFVASPYMMMYNSFSKLNENLEAVGQTMGVGRLRMLKDVFLPQSLSTVLEAGSYFFVNCMMTISAVSFLGSSSAIKPVALMINQFEAQMQLECAAVVSLMILLVNMLLKLFIFLLKKGVKKHAEGKRYAYKKTV